MITVDFNHIPQDAHQRLLDIGCGNGRHMAAAFDRGVGLVIGADANLDDLGQARNRMHFHQSVRNGGPWGVSGADVTRLPFADAAFSVVICSEVLEHIPDDAAAIAEMIRVLEKEGLLVVSVPNRWPETICWLLSRQYRTSEGGHIRIYRKGTLRRRIESAGMTHIRTHWAHSLHVPYWWLKCLLGIDKDALWPVVQYHRLLTWDLMQAPLLTRLLDRWFNPIAGKSVVLYFRKYRARPETG